VAMMQADGDVDEEEEEEEWVRAESKGEPQAPPDRGAIVLDEVSIET